MHKMAKKIYESKKAALAAGDEAVVEQIGEGKDIMSVLCTLRLLFVVAFLSLMVYQYGLT